MGRRAQPAKGQADAKRPPARKAPKGKGAKVRDLEKRLAELLKREAEASLEQLQTRDRELAEARAQLTAEHAQVSESHEQQTATAEILRVIARSPTDLQPVFEVIVRSAAQLCDGVQSNLQVFDGDLLHLGATYNWPREGLERARASFPMRPDRSWAAGRV